MCFVAIIGLVFLANMVRKRIIILEDIQAHEIQVVLLMGKKMKMEDDNESIKTIAGK